MIGWLNPPPHAFPADVQRKDCLRPLSARWSLGFEVDDLDASAKRLTDSGWEVSRHERTAEGFREVVTLDPDGNRIRLFAWPEMV